LGLITLLTDFGTADYFVGAMKGAILSVNPRATIVDITHEIPAHDIESGAFTLLATYDTFPAGTIHLAVVDPGVGSARRAVVACAREHFFVGPDNGLFSYVLERERGTRVFHLTNEKYFRASVSPTFHGRDVFAPVAAALSNGVEASALGEQIEDFVRLSPLAPERAPDGTIRACIIHVDRFGNCVTNISRGDVPGETIERGARLSVGGHEIHSFRRFFLEEEATTGAAFAVWGSAGFLEIAVRCDSAARLLGIERGQPVLFYPSQ
jgi:S-adenosylmethionine hydrolase